MNIAVPVDFARVGELAKKVFPGDDGDPLVETKAFQFLDTGERYTRFLSF